MAAAADPMEPRVLLREVREADLAVFFEHQRDPEAARMASFPSRERETFMAHWERVLADRSNTVRTIVFDGRVAGNLVAFPQHGKTFVGYWLGRAFWGQGAATQALREFLRIVAARPLYAFVARHNAGSIRVLEKCGLARCDERDEGHRADEVRPGELLYVLRPEADDRARPEGDDHG